MFRKLSNEKQFYFYFFFTIQKSTVIERDMVGKIIVKRTEDKK